MDQKIKHRISVERDVLILGQQGAFRRCGT